MHSKSNTNSFWRAPAWGTYGISVGLHLSGALVLVGMAIYRPSPKSTVDLEVIEAPVEAPRPIRLEAKPTVAPPPERRAVFGANKKSSGSEKAVEVKAGNTLAKTPDAEKLRPEDADSLPIPTDEYLVSQMPVLLSDFRAPYPPDAKKKKIAGDIILELLVDSSGAVRDARVLKGIGFGLDEAALAAVKLAKFKPARVGEQSVAVKIRYTYRFSLE